MVCGLCALGRRSLQGQEQVLLQVVALVDLVDLLHHPEAVDEAEPPAARRREAGRERERSAGAEDGGEAETERGARLPIGTPPGRLSFGRGNVSPAPAPIHTRPARPGGTGVNPGDADASRPSLTAPRRCRTSPLAHEDAATGGRPAASAPATGAGIVVRTFVAGPVATNTHLRGRRGGARGRRHRPGGRRRRDRRLPARARTAPRGDRQHPRTLRPRQRQPRAPGGHRRPAPDAPRRRAARRPGRRRSPLRPHAGEDSPPPDRFLDEGDEVRAGAIALRVLHTPGHTPGGITLVGGGAAFCGDLLFAGGPGPDRAAGLLAGTALRVDPGTDLHPSRRDDPLPRARPEHDRRRGRDNPRYAADSPR